MLDSLESIKHEVKAQMYSKDLKFKALECPPSQTEPHVTADNIRKTYGLLQSATAKQAEDDKTLN